MTIAQLSETWTPVKYREDCPPDRALVLRQGDHTRVLGYIGPGIDYYHDNTSFEQSLGFYEFDGIPDGLWVWEGRLHCEKDSYFHEWEIELMGDHRPLTLDELDQFADGDFEPWDKALWVST